MLYAVLQKHKGGSDWVWVGTVQDGTSVERTTQEGRRKREGRVELT